MTVFGETLRTLRLIFEREDRGRQSVS
jgi:hypothetical protein